MKKLINKLSTIVFIMSLKIFNLNIGMNHSLLDIKTAEQQISEWKRVPLEIKYEFLNKLVNELLKDEQNLINNLEAIEAINIIYNKILNLKLVDKDFNNLIANYIWDNYGLINILKLNKIDVKENIPNFLFNTTEKGYMPLIYWLINIDNKEKNNKNLALILAAQYGHLNIVKLLINNNANVNAKNNNDVTALILASKNGHLDIVKLLIDNKANINAENNYGNAALIYAVKRGHFDMVNLLIKNKIDVNSQNNYGNTPLIWACLKGFTNIVKLLIDNKVNINAKNNYGNTALKFAVDKMHKSIIKILINNNADVNIANKWDDTALTTALRKGNKKIITLLNVNKNEKQL